MIALLALVGGLAGSYVIAARILHCAEPEAPCPWPVDDIRPANLLKISPHVSGDSE